MERVPGRTRPAWVYWRQRPRGRLATRQPRKQVPISFRLLVTDLDGTLFGHDLVVSPRTRAALGRWTARGGLVAIATGRMFRATRPIAEDLGVTTPLICYQGAWIRHPLTLADLWHRTLEPAPARAAIAALEAAGFGVQLFLDDELYVTGIGPAQRAYMALSRIAPREVAHWDEVFAAGAPTKIVAIASEAEVRRQVQAMREAFGESLYVVQSQPTFLEVAHREVNKGVALAKLVAGLGIPLSEVVAVGDGQNDVDMIRLAGLGVAMGNGHPELRAAAGRVTGPLAEDGVAALIDDLLAEGAL